MLQDSPRSPQMPGVMRITLMQNELDILLGTDQNRYKKMQSEIIEAYRYEENGDLDSAEKLFEKNQG